MIQIKKWGKSSHVWEFRTHDTNDTQARNAHNAMHCAALRCRLFTELTWVVPKSKGRAEVFFCVMRHCNRRSPIKTRLQGDSRETPMWFSDGISLWFLAPLLLFSHFLIFFPIFRWVSTGCQEYWHRSLRVHKPRKAYPWRKANTKSCSRGNRWVSLVQKSVAKSHCKFWCPPLLPWNQIWSCAYLCLSAHIPAALV